MGVKKILRVTTIVVAAATSAAWAKEPAVVVGGGASVKCGEWLAERTKTDRTLRTSMVSSWVQGFLSGINTERLAQKGSPQFEIPSYEVLDAMVDKHCRDDPLQSIWEASVKVMFELTRRSPLPAK